MRRKSRAEEERNEAVGSVELKGGIGGERDMVGFFGLGRRKKRRRGGGWILEIGDGKFGGER